MNSYGRSKILRNGGRAVAGGDEGYRPKMKINYSDDRPNQKRARIEEPYNLMQGVPKRRDTYEAGFRLLVILLGVAMAVLGVWLSYKFFDIEAPELWWVGVLLGVLFFFLELIIQRGGGGNPILLIAGVLAYWYSIRANIEALAGIMPNAPVDMRGFLGAIIEILPEPLILYGLFGKDMPNPLAGLWAWVKKGLAKDGR